MSDDTMYDRISSSKPTESVLVTFGVITLAICLTFCWKQWKKWRAYRHFPSKRLDIGWIFKVILGRYPKDAPFTSFLFQTLLKTANEFLEEGLCVVWLLKPHVFIFNEKYMKDLVNEIELTDKGVVFEKNRHILGNGLVASNYESWKIHRKLLNPAFSVAVLKGKMHAINKYANQLADSLSTLVDKPGDDARYFLSYCACQNMADFVLGLNMNNEKHVSIANNFAQTVELIGEQVLSKGSRPWLSWDFMLPLFPSGRKYLKIADDVNRHIREIMNELMEKNDWSDRKQPNDDSQVLSSFGDILMKLYLQDHVLTKKDVRDQLVNFAFGGYITISGTMLWCFYTLGHHPEVQEKAYREMQSLVPDGDIAYEDLPKLKYLDCVIKDTLRLYSTGPIYERKARKDIQCGRYIIPKGSDVGVFPFIMHRDPNVFPEPKKFNPERFWDNSELRPWMYQPFSEGYRSCIGKKFAMMEIKVNLLHVLRRFRIRSLNKINDTDLDWAITLKPTKPLRFSFEKRLSPS